MKQILMILSFACACSHALAQRYPTVQLRTNGLYCLAASPNVGLEIQTDLGIAWQLDFVGAWWNSYKTNRFWSNYAFQTEMRYYTSGGHSGLPYKGHHVGLYAQLVTYDFELGKKGVMCPDLGDTWSIGISYGYTKPLTQNLALDVTVGIGYIKSQYDVYRPNFDNSWWTRTKTGTFRGALPTKAEVSLVWTINSANPMVSKKTKSIIYY